jgi:restriction endonuclease S subunit
MRNLAIPTPPLEEQSEIVRRINHLFTLADTIERRVRATATMVITASTTKTGCRLRILRQ